MIVGPRSDGVRCLRKARVHSRPLLTRLHKHTEECWVALELAACDAFQLLTQETADEVDNVGTVVAERPSSFWVHATVNVIDGLAAMHGHGFIDVSKITQAVVGTIDKCSELASSRLTKLRKLHIAKATIRTAEVMMSNKETGGRSGTRRQFTLKNLNTAGSFPLAAGAGGGATQA